MLAQDKKMTSSFNPNETSQKVKIGVTIPSTALTHIDEAIETGLFSHRSDFVTQAVLFFIEQRRGD